MSIKLNPTGKRKGFDKSKSNQKTDEVRNTKRKKLNAHDKSILTTSTSVNKLWTDRLCEKTLRNGKPIEKTVSIAFPSSILRHCHSVEQKTILIGSIARSCALNEVNEIIVFMDSVTEQTSDPDRAPSHTICRILQYIETPSYLRKVIFPFHSDFRHIGLLTAIDMPHHVRKEDNSWFREGVVIDDTSSSNNRSSVDAGLGNPILIDQSIEAGYRVTVQIESENTGKVVSPDDPRQYGLYWGYRTRLASSFGEIFTSEYENSSGEKESYDCIIGYSSKGANSLDNSSFSLPEFKHLLIVFGGEDGLEGCIESDENFPYSAKEVNKLFHYVLNMCPSYGCRVVRPEDAIITSLARIRPLVYNRS